MPSTFYNSMATNTGDLNPLFLDFPFNPSGDYSKQELIKAAAYTVLAHSEIEGYFEKVVADVISAAEVSWKNDGKFSRTLLCLCYFHMGTANPPQQKPSKDIWNEPVYQSLAKARGQIKVNHGIRPSNIVPLLAMVGFDVRTVEEDLLAQLDAFGSMRGHHAHNSLVDQVGQVFDPFDRKKKVEELLTAMELFDVQFLEFRNAQFDPNYVSPRGLLKKVKRFLKNLV